MTPRPIVKGGQGHTAQDVIDDASGAAAWAIGAVAVLVFSILWWWFS
jgi:hypothetical protein